MRVASRPRWFLLEFVPVAERGVPVATSVSLVGSGLTVPVAQVPAGNYKVIVAEYSNNDLDEPVFKQGANEKKPRKNEGTHTVPP